MDDSEEGIRFYRHIGTEIDKALNDFVLDSVTSAITTLNPVILAGLTLYIMVLGFHLLMGKASSEIFITMAVKTSVVIAILANYGNYNTYVVGLYQAFESGMLTIVASGIDHDATVDVFGVLDAALDATFGKIAEAATQGNDVSTLNVGGQIMWFLVMGLLSIAIGLMTLMGAVIMFSAKVAIATMLAIGPVFIVMALFPITSRFTSLWAGQIINYTMQIFFVTVFLAFSLRIGVGFINDISFADAESGETTNPFISAVTVLFLGVVLYWLLKQVNSLSAAVAGGVSLSSQNLSNIKNKAKNLLNPTNIRTDAEGSRKTDTLLGHRGTVARQRALQNEKAKEEIPKLPNLPSNGMLLNTINKGIKAPNSVKIDSKNRHQNHLPNKYRTA